MKAGRANFSVCTGAAHSADKNGNFNNHALHMEVQTPQVLRDSNSDSKNSPSRNCAIAWGSSNLRGYRTSHKLGGRTVLHGIQLRPSGRSRCHKTRGVPRSTHPHHGAADACSPPPPSRHPMSFESANTSAPSSAARTHKKSMIVGLGACNSRQC